MNTFLSALIALALCLPAATALADRDEDKHEWKEHKKERHEYEKERRKEDKKHRHDDDERHDRGLHRGHDNPNNPHYRGHSGRDWDRDYGVLRGRCDSEAAGAAVGAAVGGIVGAQVGKDGDRRVATVIGAAVGAVLGAKVARDIDRRDAACIGHSLELARNGERVVWERDRRRYEVRPIDRFTRGTTVCRTYELISDGRSVRQTACQSSPGVWESR